MRRDMDLVRQILLRVEEDDDSSRGFFQVPGYDQDTVSRHVVLLMDYGLVEASLIGTSVAPIGARIFRLTWAGHDFLEAVRSDTIWSRTKSFIAEKGGSLTFEVVKLVAITLTKSQLGLHDG